MTAEKTVKPHDDKTIKTLNKGTTEIPARVSVSQVIMDNPLQEYWGPVAYILASLFPPPGCPFIWPLLKIEQGADKLVQLFRCAHHGINGDTCSEEFLTLTFK